jgi:Tfp pilus assembly protein PilV
VKRRHAVSADDRGFSLMEIVISLMVVMVTILALTTVFVSVLSTAGLSRERQQATALANQALESMRALPYATVTQGLANWGTELNDPNISVGHFKPTYNGAIDEVLQTYVPVTDPSTQSPAPPLYPHITTLTENNVSFTLSRYVSQVAGSSPPAFWLTALVQWSSTATRHKTKTLALRTQLYSPAGCLDLKTHPFSGPCQAFLYSNAGVAAGSISLTGPTAASPLFSGLTATTASLILAELTSNLQIEQVTSVGGRTSTSGATFDLTDGTSPRTGDLSSTGLADTDPSTTGNASFTAPSTAQSAAPLTNAGAGAALTLKATTGDSGSAVGTVAASASPACTDVTGGAAFATGLPCGSGSLATSMGNSSTALDFGTITGRHLSATLGSVAAGSTSSTLATRFMAPNATYCPSATGDGCAVGSVKRSLGAVMLGGAPDGAAGDTLSSAGMAGTTPLGSSGFAGLVTLSSYADSATAVAGSGAAAPTATRSGTVQYWDPAHCPSGYCALTLGASAASATSSATAHYLLSDGEYLDVAMTATITVPAAAPVTTGTAPCQTSPCTVDTSVAPPRISISYLIRRGDTTFGQFTMTADLGTLVAKASYRAAPSA